MRNASTETKLAPKPAWWRDVTPYQWLVLFVAWLGWVFDSMDATIYALVLHPALHDLLPATTGGTVKSCVLRNCR